MSEQLSKLLGLRVTELNDNDAEKYGGRYAYPLNDTGSQVVGFQSPDEAVEHWLASVTDQHIVDGIKRLADALDAANARVAELERIWAWAESEKRLAIQQASETKGTMRAMCSGYAKAMAKISSRMEKVLTQ